MTEAKATTEQLVKARELLQKGELEPSLAVLVQYLQVAPADCDALTLLARVLEQANRDEAANNVNALAARIREIVMEGGLPFADDRIVLPLYEAAFGMIDVRQFELAAKFLEKCVELSPDEPVVKYELAFSLMALNQYEKALEHLRDAVRELNDFDTHLNILVCLILLRDLNGAKQALEELTKHVKEDEERKELAHRRTVIRRLESLGTRTELNARDWLYALYGSVLLHPGYKRSTHAEDIKSVATTIVILQGVLEGLRLELEVIEYYNPVSKPLARVIAELMDLPLDSYKGPDRPEKALLVMAWASDIVGPHQSFIDMCEKRTLFTYGLPWREPLPVTPELVGCLATEFPMPWSEETRNGSLETVVNQILDKARDLDSDTEILKLTQNAVEYYHLKREWLMLNNFEGFPERPEYTAEIPG